MSLQFAYYCYSSTTPAARHEKVEIENNGVNIDYEDSFNGDTALVFVHGWCLNKSYWSGQRSHFKKRYRVITVDLPGFGRSGKNRSDWSVEEHARDINAVLNQLKLKDAILIGHSTSGTVVIEAALHNYDRVLGLIGVESLKVTSEPEKIVFKHLTEGSVMKAARTFRRLAAEYANLALFSKLTLPAVKKRVLSDIERVDSKIAGACLREVEAYRTRANISALRKKLYLINSGHSSTDLSFLDRNKISYSIREFEGTGNYPMIEKPGQLNSYLEETISKIKSDMAIA